MKLNVKALALASGLPRLRLLGVLFLDEQQGTGVASTQP